MRYLKLSLILTLIFPALVLAAGTPDRINYQGVLRNNSGVPETGTFDMKFRLFDAANAGNEVVVDAHLAAGTGGVGVTGGLFSVALGSGTVSDGSGPGVFTSFADAVAQNAAVWLEIEVGGETLTPRVAVLASAYALNAKTLQGKAPSEFLDTSATPQTKTGKITANGGIDFGPGATDELTAATVNTLTGGGNADSLHTHALVAQSNNANLLDSIDSSQFLRSDTDDTYTSGTLTLAPGTVLNAKGQVRLDGSLFMDGDGPDGSQAILFYDQGNPMGQAFMWDKTLDRFTLSNTLRVQNGHELEITGNSLGMNSDGPDATQSIYFYDHGEPTGQSIDWDEAASRFSFSSTGRFEGALSTAGNVTVGNNATVMGQSLSLGAGGPDQAQVIGFYNNGGANTEQFWWDDGADKFRITDDLNVGGNLEVFLHTLSLGGQGIEANQSINFFEDGSFAGESISWDDGQDRFEMTDELAIGGTIRTGSTTTAPVLYNTMGSGTPGSADITTSSDLLVTADLEVGDQLYFGSPEYLQWLDADSVFYFSNAVHIGDGVGDNVYIGGRRLYLEAGSPANSPPNYYLEHISGAFELTDDLHVSGILTATSKNFLQNHPYDPSLEIVYTSLEGPEASTFTRGSAKLEDGVAKIALNESFAWVTHPDLGLTVTLTPRGGFAELYVDKISTTELVVKAAPGTKPDAAFDYLVLGLRVGMEEQPVVRPKTKDAPLPDPANFRASIAGRPDLARFTPLAQHRAGAVKAFGEAPADLSAGDALRNAIGTSLAVGERMVISNDTEPERGSSTARNVAPTPRTEEGAGSQGARSKQEAPTHAPATGRSYEDEQGNLYARSFRPNSGGLDAISPVVGDVEEGDVVILDASGHGLRRSDAAADPTVVGIATGTPRAGADGASVASFAVAGIVACKVDASYGAIVAGDQLVTSATPGHAMRASAPGSGTVVGKALESLASGTGTIRVLVTLR